MAIALPPPIPPQMASVVELRAQAQTQAQIIIDHLGYRLHIFGNPALSADLLRQGIQATANVSDAVRVIGGLCYAAGYPATVLSYGWAGGADKDIFVRIVPATIKDVRGPASLQPYFENLKNGKPLTQSALQRDYTLADIHSDRAGENYSPVFKVTSDNAVMLDLGTAQAGKRRTTVLGSLSNYGNRYAGPFLANAGLRQSFGSGTQLALGGTAARESDGNAYYDGSGSGSQVTRYGIVELEARHARFKQVPQDQKFDGTLDAVALSWLFPLLANFEQRLSLRARLQHDELSIDGPGLLSGQRIDDTLARLLLQLGLTPRDALQAQEVLSEHYASAELMLNYLQRFRLANRSAELQASLSARKGLGASNGASTTRADLDYLLLKPTLNLRYTLSSEWALLGEADLQFSDDVLPQQQQYVIGGPGNAAAYEPGAGIGDHGFNLRLGAEWRRRDGSWLDRYEVRPKLFVEYGRTSLRGRSELETSPTVELADLALAVDLRVNQWLSGALSISQTLSLFDDDRKPDAAAENRFFFQLTGRY